MSFLEQKKINAISSLNDICYYIHAEDEDCREACPVRGLTEQIHAINGLQINVNNRLRRIVLT